MNSNSDSFTSSVNTIDQLSELKTGYNNYKGCPPTKECCNTVVEILKLTNTKDLNPNKIVPDCDGGIALYWFLYEKEDFLRLSLNIDNDLSVCFCEKIKIGNTEKFAAKEINIDNIESILDKIKCKLESAITTDEQTKDI